MVKNAGILIPFTVLLIGCTDGQTPKQGASQGSNGKAQATSAQIDSYKKWLADLNSRDAERSKIAVENFKSADSSVISFLFEHVEFCQPKLRDTVYKLILDRDDALKPYRAELLASFEARWTSPNTSSRIADILIRHSDHSKLSVDLANSCKRDKRLQYIGLRAISRMGKEASPAIPTLIEILDKDDRRHFPVTLRTLVKIGCGESEHWLNYLKKALPAIGRKENHKRKLFETLGGFGERAIPLLVSLLNHSSPHTQANAAAALKTTGPASVPLLIKSMEEKKLQGAHYEVMILDSLGKAATPSIPTLKKHYLANQKRNYRSLNLIAKLREPGFDALLTIFKSANDGKAALLLCRGGEKGALILAKEFKSLTPEQKPLALKAFRGYPLRIGTAVTPFLTEELKGADDQLRLELILALKAFGANAVSAIPVLAECFLKRDKAGNASSRLRSSQGTNAAAIFVKGVGSEETAIRIQSIHALKALRFTRADAHSQVALCLSHKDRKVRMAAIDYLSAFHARSNPSVPALLKFALDEKTGDRHVAVSALNKIETKDACLALIKCLKANDRTLLMNALDSLTQFTDFGELIVPAFLSVANDMTVELQDRYDALKLLPRVKSKDGLKVPVLMKLAEDKKGVPGIRRQAILTLGEFPQAGSTITPFFLRFMTNEDQSLRAAACSSLGKSGPKNNTVMAALKKASNARDKEVSRCAKEALAAMSKR